MVEDQVRDKSKQVEEDIERLRNWLNKQPHLPQNVDQEFLRVFVQGTKTLEHAKRKLDGYYSARTKAPKMYDLKARDATDTRFQELSKAVDLFFLPETTPDGYRVGLLRPTEEHFEQHFDQHQTNVRFLMLLELALLQWPDARGFILVMDLKNVKANVITKINPTSLVSVLGCFQSGYPMKVKGIYLVNSLPIVEFIVNTIAKPVTKSKLFSRITVTNEDITSIKYHVPTEILPSDHGGKAKSSRELNDYWLDQCKEKKEWFSFTSQQASDENKRPPDSQNTYGVDGTFRKLAVD